MNDYYRVQNKHSTAMQNRKWFRRTAVFLSAVLAFTAVMASTVYVSADLSDFEDGPDAAAGAYVLAENEYIDQNWLERAGTVLSSTLTSPRSFDDYYQLAEIAISRSDYSTALKHIETCLTLIDSKPSGQAKIYLVKGSLETLLGQDDAALLSLAKAINFNPQLGDAYLVQTQIYIERAEWSKAADVLAFYFERSPQINTRMYAAMGELQMMLGDYPAAVDYYSLSIQKHNALDPQIYVKRGGCYAQLAACKEAVNDYFRAAELGSEPSQYIDNLVLCQLILKDYKGVLDTGAILAVDKRSAGLLQNMGVASMALDQMSEAERYFDRAILLENELPSAYYYRGICRLSLERFDEACVDFSTSIARGEALQLSYYNRGVCYLKSEQFNEAQLDLERTVLADDDPLITKSARAILQQLGGS